MVRLSLKLGTSIGCSLELKARLALLLTVALGHRWVLVPLGLKRLYRGSFSSLS
jgi:hypothetical protein